MRTIELVGGPYDGREIPAGMREMRVIYMPELPPVISIEDICEPSFKVLTYVRARCRDGSTVFVLDRVYRTLT